MRNEIVQKIGQECTKLNPMGISMQLEIQANTIMELLLELKEDSKYAIIANKAIVQLGHTINKEVHEAMRTETEADKKNAPQIRKTEYYDKAHKAVEQIKFDLTTLLDAE